MRVNGFLCVTRDLAAVTSWLTHCCSSVAHGASKNRSRANRVIANDDRRTKVARLQHVRFLVAGKAVHLQFRIANQKHRVLIQISDSTTHASQPWLIGQVLPPDQVRFIGVPDQRHVRHCFVQPAKDVWIETQSLQRQPFVVCKPRQKHIDQFQSVTVRSPMNRLPEVAPRSTSRNCDSDDVAMSTSGWP